MQTWWEGLSTLFPCVSWLFYSIILSLLLPIIPQFDSITPYLNSILPKLLLAWNTNMQAHMKKNDTVVNIKVTHAQPTMNVENENCACPISIGNAQFFAWKFIHSLAWCNRLVIGSTSATSSLFPLRWLLVVINFCISSPGQIGEDNATGWEWQASIHHQSLLTG